MPDDEKKKQRIISLRQRIAELEGKEADYAAKGLKTMQKSTAAHIKRYKEELAKLTAEPTVTPVRKKLLGIRGITAGITPEQVDAYEAGTLNKGSRAYKAISEILGIKILGKVIPKVIPEEEKHELTGEERKKLTGIRGIIAGITPEQVSAYEAGTLSRDSGAYKTIATILGKWKPTPAPSIEELQDRARAKALKELYPTATDEDISEYIAYWKEKGTTGDKGADEAISKAVPEKAKPPAPAVKELPPLPSKVPYDPTKSPVFEDLMKYVIGEARLFQSTLPEDIAKDQLI